MQEVCFDKLVALEQLSSERQQLEELHICRTLHDGTDQGPPLIETTAKEETSTDEGFFCFNKIADLFSRPIWFTIQHNSGQKLTHSSWTKLNCQDCVSPCTSHQ